MTEPNQQQEQQQQQWIRKTNDDTISDKDDELYHNIAQEKFKSLSIDRKIQIIKHGEPGYSEIEVICDTIIEEEEIYRRIYEFCILERMNDKDIL